MYRYLNFKLFIEQYFLNNTAKVLNITAKFFNAAYRPKYAVVMPSRPCPNSSEMIIRAL